MKKLALIVDDVDINRDILSEMLEEDFDILQAEDGEQAIDLIKEHLDNLNLILLDIMMPKVNGIEVLEQMQANGWNSKIPVIIITGEKSLSVEQRCFDLGIFDFVNKPFKRNQVKRRAKNAADLFNYKLSLEDEVDRKTKELVEKNNQLVLLNDSIIETVADIVEARSLESGQHVKRVKGLTRIIANCIMEDYPEYGLTEEKVELITSSSALHDVGKIMIPDNILLKPGKLTPEEFDVIKTHTTLGVDVLKNVSKYWDPLKLEYSILIAKYHHEKWDGRGYPEGLKGDNIPICAQIVSLADVCDALTTERVYKKAFTYDEAFNMIINNECGVFNPKIIACFIKCRKEMEEYSRAVLGNKVAL